MAGPGTRLPYAAWCAKVNRILGETNNGGYSIVKFLGLDDEGKPLTEDADPAQFEGENRPAEGHYQLVDENGDVVTECVLTRRGEMVTRRHSPINPEAVMARSLSALSESWGQLAVFQRQDGDALKAKIAKLEAENHVLREENLALKAESHGEDADLIALAPKVLDLLAGQKSATNDIAFLNRVLPKLSPEAQKEMLAIVMPGADG